MTATLTRRSLMLGAATAGAGLVVATVAACAGPRAATSSPSPTPEPVAPTSTATPAPEPAAAPAPARPRTLLVYFSRPGENYYYGGRRVLDVGNTEVVATMITDRVACDVYRLEAGEPYSDNYEETVTRNGQEQRADARPAIANALPDVTGYDTILLGSPIWNVRPPMIMSTFLDQVDLAGKKVLPFVTYAVSQLGNTLDVYRAAAPAAQFGAGLAVQGETVTDATQQIETWLTQTGIAS